MAVDSDNLAIPSPEEMRGLGQLLDAFWVGLTPRCRVCGCTDDNACIGGCSWVEPDLCSDCVGNV